MIISVGAVTSGRTATRRGAGALLVCVMAVGSLVLWTVIPAAWLRIAAALSDARPVGYVIALFGAPATMLAWGRGLFGISCAYARLRGADERERGSHSLLELMIVVSAALGLLAFAAWFFFLAGSPTATPWPDELSGPGE